MKRLESKIAIITGAASGLGKAITLLYASEGAKVVAVDINAKALSLLKDEVTTKGCIITTVVANMAKGDDIENMVKAAVDTYTTVDILVNNTGIMDDFSSAGDVNDQLWDRVMAINLNGSFKAMRSVLKILLAKNRVLSLTLLQ